MKQELFGAVVAMVFGMLPMSAGAQGANQRGAAGDLPAGAWTLDKAHASLAFHVSHLGFSNFTSRFSEFDATLELDPKHPSAARVTATIDPRSVEIHHSTLGTDLQGPKWFDSAKFPPMTFKSLHVVPESANTAHVDGALTLHGVTQPVSFEAKFNGGYSRNPFDPAGARVGFSAHGALKRSLFGLVFGLPPAGTTFGVGDDVTFDIEAEFTHPNPPAAK